MLCKKPFAQGLSRFGCGQCMPCRINRRRLWAFRIILEAYKHPYSCFCTFTYNDESLPGDGSLRPDDFSRFLDTYRKSIRPEKVRYFMVGEYGDETWRPHYHAALFGVPRTDDRIQHAWKLGFVHAGDLTPQSAAYLAGYVTKKLTSAEDVRLGGRYPEFARMSLRPGIAANSMADVAASMMEDAEGAKEICRIGDVPGALRVGGSTYPLGRYLRSKLREEMGFESSKAPDGWQKHQLAELQALFDAQGGIAEGFAYRDKTEAVKIRQIETKAKIWSKKGKL